MKILKTISNSIYQWILDTHSNDYSYFQNDFANNANGHTNGMMYMLIALLLVSLIATAVYYYGVASKVANATKKNYMVVYLLGLITLIVVNFVVMATIPEMKNVFTSYNMWMINLIDVLYYTILFQLWSWLVKSTSKSPNIDLISIVFNK